jgi:hypothetical protein
VFAVEACEISDDSLRLCLLKKDLTDVCLAFTSRFFDIFCFYTEDA